MPLLCLNSRLNMRTGLLRAVNTEQALTTHARKEHEMASPILPQPEEWRPVLGLEESHRVSSLGRVRRLAGVAANGQRLGALEIVPLTIPSGYQVVHLLSRGRSRRIFLHRVVLEAFVGPRPEGMVCRHLDGDKTNNSVSNLCWGTQKQNVRDSMRHGTVVRGELKSTSKLTSGQVLEIRRKLGEGATLSALGREYGVAHQTIRSIKLRKKWAWL